VGLWYADASHVRDCDQVLALDYIISVNSRLNGATAITHTNPMPPKGSKKASAAAHSQTLVLDNGAYTLKAGLVSTSSGDASYDNCSVIPNCIARSTRDKCTYVASELAHCKDFGELAFRRPVEKGFIVNWEAEKAIWEHEFMGTSAGEGLRVGTIYV
jgi:actin-related protein 6